VWGEGGGGGGGWACPGFGLSLGGLPGGGGWGAYGEGGGGGEGGVGAGGGPGVGLYAILPLPLYGTRGWWFEGWSVHDIAITIVWCMA